MKHCLKIFASKEIVIEEKVEYITSNLNYRILQPSVMFSSACGRRVDNFLMFIMFLLKYFCEQWKGIFLFLSEKRLTRAIYTEC